MGDVSATCPVPESVVVVVDPAAGSGTERDREMNITDTVEGEGKSVSLRLYLCLLSGIIRIKSYLQMTEASRTPFPSFL